MTLSRYILIIIVIIFILYFNSLFGVFVSDNVWLTSSISVDNYAQTHHLTTFSYFIKFNPLAYHILALILHSIAVITLFFLLRLFYRNIIAFIGAIFFAINPVHVESITWSAGNIYLLYGILFILIFITYYKGVIINWKPKLYILSLFLVIIYSFKGYPWMFLASLVLLTTEFIYNKKANIIRWIPFILIPLISLIIYNSSAINRIQKVSHFSTNYFLVDIPLVRFLLSMFHNLYLMILPIKLSIYHEPIIFSIQGILLQSLSILLIIYIIIRNFNKISKEIKLALSIFVIILAYTYCPIPFAFFLAERYLYIPTIAYSIWLCQMLKTRSCILVILILTLILPFYCIRTIIRNNDYLSEKRYWKSTVKASPNSPRAHNNLGVIYLRENNFIEARKEFNIAIKLDPKIKEGYNNIKSIQGY